MPLDNNGAYRNGAIGLSQPQIFPQNTRFTSAFVEVDKKNGPNLN